MAAITKVSRKLHDAYKAVIRLRGIKPFSKTSKLKKHARHRLSTWNGTSKHPVPTVLLMRESCYTSTIAQNRIRAVSPISTGGSVITET